MPATELSDNRIRVVLVIPPIFHLYHIKSITHKGQMQELNAPSDDKISVQILRGRHSKTTAIRKISHTNVHCASDWRCQSNIGRLPLPSLYHNFVYLPCRMTLTTHYRLRRLWTVCYQIHLWLKS